MRPAYCVLVFGFWVVTGLTGCNQRSLRTVCSMSSAGFCLCLTEETAETGDAECDVVALPGWSCCLFPEPSTQCGCTPEPCPPAATDVFDCRQESMDRAAHMTGSLVCPDPHLRRCEVDADCCTGFCGYISSGDGMMHCTIECTDDADCTSSPVWHGSGHGCNPITHHCTD